MRYQKKKKNNSLYKVFTAISGSNNIITQKAFFYERFIFLDIRFTLHISHENITFKNVFNPWT